MSSTNMNAVTLERILERMNLYKAIKSVRDNKGAPGVDGMKVEALEPYLTGREYPKTLTQAVLAKAV